MPLDNFGIVESRPRDAFTKDGPKLYRCAQPDAKGFEALKSLGVTFSYKLNSDVEYQLAREAAYMAPGQVQQDGRVTQFFAGHQAVMDAARELAAIWKTVSTAGDSMVVHCSMGRDRTGLLVAAYRLMFTEAARAAVEDEMRAYGAVGVLGALDFQVFECVRAIAQEVGK